MVKKVGGVSHLGGAENGEIVAKKNIAMRSQDRFWGTKFF